MGKKASCESMADIDYQREAEDLREQLAMVSEMCKELEKVVIALSAAMRINSDYKSRYGWR